MIVHLLVTNLNWASLNLPAPLLPCEIIDSTLPASYQHPLTHKHTESSRGSWQMLAMREKGLGYLYNEIWKLWPGGEHEHCKLIAASPDQLEAEVNSPVNHLSSGWQGERVLVTVMAVPASVRIPLSPSSEQVWLAVGNEVPGSSADNNNCPTPDSWDRPRRWPSCGRGSAHPKLGKISNPSSTTYSICQLGQVLHISVPQWRIMNIFSTL